MSWVFFAGDDVYKLKKPARLPYLDYSTLSRREAACRAELTLNQTLAAPVYRAVVPLRRRGGDLILGGDGEIVDWLVLMRRLDERCTLEARIAAGDLGAGELDALAGVLAGFYSRARPVRRTPAAQMAQWRSALTVNRTLLTDPRLGLPRGPIRRIDAIQRRFLRTCSHLLVARARGRRILDAHGDLRPEHVWMGPPILIIDRLEFSAALRAVDPLDELAFLELETERLGGLKVGARVARKVLMAMRERPPEVLWRFYRSYRAMVRARLAIAHLLEPEPRTPAKWPTQARAYLAIALRDALRLERLINRRRGR